MAKEFNPEEMDRAAKQAGQELENLIVELDGTAFNQGLLCVASWWASWYLTAGHKRLGRILVGIHNKQKRS